MNGQFLVLSKGKQYTAAKSLTKTTQLHALAITSGLLCPHLRSDLSVSYANCGHIGNARKLFDEMPQPTLFSHNMMLRMYTKNGFYLETLNLFVEMVNLGKCMADNYTYPFVFKAIGEEKLVDFGGVVHGRVLTGGFERDSFVMNSLLTMYMNCRKKEEGGKVFDSMWKPNVVSWNSMISGYFKNGCAEEALGIFNKMADDEVEMDCATVVSVLPVCGFLKELQVGRRVYELVKKNGWGKEIVVRNALIDMFAKCGSMEEAMLVFDSMVEKDVVTWTSLINVYILNGDVRAALRLCFLMVLEGVRPNSVTLASLLSACGESKNLMDGRCLHGWAIRQKLESDVMVETSLIDMYAKCNNFELSFQVFKRTSKKKTVPWNAILAGCIHNRLGNEAIKFFKEMLMEGVKPDDATLKSFLPAYAIHADLQQARNMHSYLIKSGLLSNSEIATAVVDIYSKCCSLESAHKIFNGIPNENKDIYLWSVIIACYGAHGHGEIAVSLFKEMVRAGVKPNEVTFTSVLHACSHSGLVDEGLDLFKFMLRNHQISPQVDHYTCIVDLLGRSGRPAEAYDIIRTMPFAPSHAVWGALLGACVIHENVELGEIAAKWLFELEPENTGNYVLMAKIYSAVGRWKDAENMRRIINEIGLQKAPAHSLIQACQL
ncbi:pentatricopeptide repeat-containing protein At5g39350-like isoform X2 [Durio zibethinus]|uniref:Pentatricopeptide repeat-containing protein At5g39350-like isoform X2 n=1 Tax=Durio zibethinus TaxID=66656 RepID=A0A6P6BBR8_DURZI|nr:pentatricopeptide repeat-containing protein At5g39350-like isoform X2 [Durio zibethinus]